MPSKIDNKTSDKVHYLSKKEVDFNQRENLKLRQKRYFLNAAVIKNNGIVINVITWLMLKFFLKNKYVLYQVSSDSGDVSNFYSSFSDTDQKEPSCL